MHHDDVSLSEVHQSVEISNKKGWRKFFSFLGPAYLIGVGYMDPGNWATDLAGGSKFGYSLIWVLLMSNLMALLLQGLSARLGIVRGRDLAQANRETFPKGINFILYILAEIAIAATDLAEVLGMAIGIQLLTGLPLIWGVGITVLDTFLLLYLHRLGMRKMEAFIITLVAVIFFSFLIQIFLAKPDVAEVAAGLVPHALSNEGLYIALGIIGATVMPHNLYLHSALVQTRKIEKNDEGIRKAIKYNRIDSTIALNIAFLVNAGILILAASVFFKTGNTHIAEIKEAYRLLPGFLGNTAPVLFAIALIAAGQSSTVTGTLAGQIIMEGYLKLRISPMLRRLITRLAAIIPALIAIIIYGEDEADALLILSQVILSVQLGFAIIPLIHFVSDKKTMGKFAIKPLTKIAAWVITLLLIYLNYRMIQNEIADIIADGSIGLKALIFILAAGLATLLLYITLHPFINKRLQFRNIFMHHNVQSELKLEKKSFSRIAVALDFSNKDEVILSHARTQGNENTAYFIIHVVESASALMMGKDSHDYETRVDQETLNNYIQQLTSMGMNVSGALGYRERAKEIARMAKEFDAELLVIGAHGHKGLKDFVFGTTVDKVRHRLNIPVLVVSI